MVRIGYLTGKRILMQAFLYYVRIQSVVGVVLNFMNSMCEKRGPLFYRLATGIMFVKSERVQGGFWWKRTCSNFGVYLGVRTCELFLCFVPFVFLGFIVLTSLFYVTGEFNRFLHRG